MFKFPAHVACNLLVQVTGGVCNNVQMLSFIKVMTLTLVSTTLIIGAALVFTALLPKAFEFWPLGPRRWSKAAQILIGLTSLVICVLSVLFF